MRGEPATATVPKEPVSHATTVFPSPVRALAAIPSWLPLMLVAADVVLLGIGLWLAVFSPLSGSPTAMVVTSILVLTGAGLACAATWLPR